VELKGKRHNTYIAPEAATVAAAVLYVTDRACKQPIGRRLSLLPQTLAYDAALVCRLWSPPP